jgi:competence protein ComEC
VAAGDGLAFSELAAFPALCLSVLFLLTRPFSRQPPADEWRVTMLDVGQGLAMVIERHGKAFLIPGRHGRRATAVDR